MNTEDINKCNELFRNANTLKESARISDENTHLFEDASKLYSECSEIIFNKILHNQDVEFNSKIQFIALAHYYNYENFDCLYGFKYKNNFFPKAIEFANKAESEIIKAIKIIDDNIHLLDLKTKDFLLEMKTNWETCVYTIKIKQNEPIAKEAMFKKEYIVAFDTYNKMLKLQEKAYIHIESTDLDEVHKRISKANYIAMSANVSQAMAGIVNEKISNKKFSFDLTSDLIGHFLNTIDLILDAYRINPEIDLYRNGAERTKDNIKTLLINNKSDWFNFLLNNNNNNTLKKIMQETDNDLYKRQNAKFEIEKDKTKKFILVGLFWIVVMFCVAYLLISIATSNISWYRFIAIMFGFPLVITIIGAFILRTTDSLKEENFIKLMSLALKINLQGLRTLSNKKDTTIK